MFLQRLEAGRRLNNPKAPQGTRDLSENEAILTVQEPKENGGHLLATEVSQGADDMAAVGGRFGVQQGHQGRNLPEVTRARRLNDGVSSFLLGDAALRVPQGIHVMAPCLTPTVRTPARHAA